MEFRPLEQGKQADSGPVWPEAVDVAGLSLLELRQRLGVIKRAEARLAAMKTETLAAYAGRGGEGLARRVALEELQASKQQARREVETASQLSQVPETLDALGAGEIPEAHAKQIARAASQGPVDETVLVEAARREDFGTFSKTLRDHQYEQSGDDGKSLMAKQRERRSFRFFKSADDGMFVVNGRFDPVAGNRIEAALADEVRRLANSSKAGDQTAFDQRMADALENLVCADAKDRKPQGTTLILTAHWDALNEKLADARLVDGTPLPISETLRLACNADIVPAVFNTKGQELWVGRKHRLATEAQRAALIIRDEHCIGCGRSAVWCEAHHIKEWLSGGSTDIDNLVLVCKSCHHNIHDDGWTVHRNRNGAHELRPPPKPYADLPPGQPRPRTSLARPKSTPDAKPRPTPGARPKSTPDALVEPPPDAFPDAFPEKGITTWQPESSKQLLLN
ncbi:MAG: DUF222 domain-containing protein [Acidimicrobiia bacterium]|nr:DUF222 domain-containing protein [Acidimicrobiia bacterium]